MSKSVYRKVSLAWPVAMIIILSIASCNGCKDNQPVVVNPIEVIQSEAKPIEDSLRQVISFQNVKIDSLKAIAEKASIRKEVIRERVVDRPAPTTDSGALIAYNELKEDFDRYVVQSDIQANSQGEIIVSKDSIITTQLADIELQKSKFIKVVDAYNSQSIALDKAKKELVKSDKKLKRAKFLNKVLGVGTAAGIAIAAFVFL